MVFMQVYCGLEDPIDMINFGINPAYSPDANEKMMDAMELIGYPHPKEVLAFISENEHQVSRGKSVWKTIGTWRVSASTQLAGADEIIFVGLQSADYIDAIGN